jgi:D-glycero-D-manno-heptose 1,7-bisphosphate phosphatase
MSAPMPPASTPAVFLDRDGTLMEEAHYCSHPDQVRIIPGVPEALRALKDAGYRLVIVTNQSGIGRGYYTLADYETVQAHFLGLLGKGLIDATYFCPEAPERNSPRRKPAIGMIVEAQRDFGLDLPRSWFVGDKAVDVQCGRNAGMRPILVLTGHGAKQDPTGAEFVAKDFASAVAFILKTSDA